MKKLTAQEKFLLRMEKRSRSAKRSRKNFQVPINKMGSDLKAYYDVRNIKKVLNG